jgi:hypothetical protein
MMIFAFTAVAGETGNRAQIMATGPLSVWGHVYDLAGQPLAGAEVVVTIVRTGATATGTTDSNGLYQATPDISYTQYEVGDTIRVVADYDGAQQQTTTPVTQDMEDTGMGEVDVHYTYEIPEFGSALGLAFAFVAIAAVAVVVLSRRADR